jgi:hypothetical protein
MKLILEFNNFYKKNDIVLIKYWYKIPNKKFFFTPVRIKSVRKDGYLISHNISESKIQNAPDELIPATKIIAPYRG